VKAHECVEIFHPCPQDFNWIRQSPAFDEAKAYTMPDDLARILQPNVKLKLAQPTEMVSPSITVILAIKGRWKGRFRPEDLQSGRSLMVKLSPHNLKIPNSVGKRPFIEFFRYPIHVVFHDVVFHLAQALAPYTQNQAFYVTNSEIRADRTRAVSNCASTNFIRAEFIFKRATTPAALRAAGVVAPPCISFTGGRYAAALAAFYGPSLDVYGPV
jgi:hypothetical protein